MAAFEPVPGVPPVGVHRFLGPELPPGGPPAGHAHSHDFLLLAYFEWGGGSLRLAGREWPVEAGDAFVVAPGEVIGVGERAAGYFARHFRRAHGATPIGWRRAGRS